jgi:hypothetical protein
LASTHILWAFRALYLNVIARPTFISSKTDVQLLFLVSEPFRLNGTKSVNGIELSRLLEMMYRVALIRVHNNVRLNRPGGFTGIDCAENPVGHAQQDVIGQIAGADGPVDAISLLWPDAASVENNVPVGSNGYFFSGF